MQKGRAPNAKIINPRDYTFHRQALIGLDDLIGSVVKVGDGRGFIVADGDRNIAEGGKSYVVTAAHCLPIVPPPHLARYLEEATYPRLIGPLGADPSVTAACVFVDTMADIAVLGAPDCQALSDEHTQYEAFLSALPPFDIAAPPPRGRLRMPAFDADDPPAWRWLGEAFFPGRVLSLDGQWINCNVRRFGGPLLIEPEELAKDGMSGSPLISATGAALGVVSTSNWASVLADGLPGWLLRALACAS
jgi:Trypsin-like peptidase domain